VANATTAIKGFLSKIGLSSFTRSNCWSVLRVEKMLHDFGISNFEILNQSKVVKLKSEDDLLTILAQLMPHDVSEGYSLSINRVGDKTAFRFACWQFEARRDVGLK